MAFRQLILPAAAAVLGAAGLILGLVAGSALAAGVGGLALGLGIGFFGRGLEASAPAPTSPTMPDRASVVANLNDFELRAKVKGDFEVARLADRLEKIHPRLEQTLTLGSDDAAMLGHKLHQLFDQSAAGLRRAFDLHLAAREMATPDARQSISDQRAELVTEATAAVDAIDKGIDRLATAAAGKGTAASREAMADLSGDLDRQLEVARRVDERMKQLEARANGPDLAQHEEYLKS